MDKLRLLPEVAFEAGSTDGVCSGGSDGKGLKEEHEPSPTVVKVLSTF